EVGLVGRNVELAGVRGMVTAEACVVEEQRQSLPLTTATSKHCRGLLNAETNLLLAAAGDYEKLGLRLYRAQAMETPPRCLSIAAKQQPPDPHMERLCGSTQTSRHPGTWS